MFSFDVRCSTAPLPPPPATPILATNEIPLRQGIRLLPGMGGMTSMLGRRAMKSPAPSIGSLFLVPLSDGSGAVGQIVGREPGMLNSWTCAFSGLRADCDAVLLPDSGIGPKGAISVQFVTGDLLKSGRWKIFAQAPVLIPQSYFPHEDCRSNGWVGAKMIGSGNIQAFLSAYHGLEYWDEMKDPEYYDRLLLPHVSRPVGIKTKNEPDRVPGGI